MSDNPYHRAHEHTCPRCGSNLCRLNAEVWIEKHGSPDIKLGHSALKAVLRDYRRKVTPVEYHRWMFRGGS